MSLVTESIVDVLRRWAGTQPHRPAYAFLPDGRTEAARLSFADTDRRARAIAAYLQQHTNAGDRVMITYPAKRGLDYVTSVLGCLYAGEIAVPCNAPTGRSAAERLTWIAHDAEPAAILGPVHETGPLSADATMRLDVADAPDSLAGDWQAPHHTLDTLALLQYTSGSTRWPRGVMVSHGNIIANERAIQRICENDSDSTFVGWLPLFHDMGLIANVLQPLYLGALSVLMPPLAFLADPIAWLRAISRYRRVTSGGPNFAYDLCVRRATPQTCQDLDLSTWRVAFNGAEVVRSATLRRFSAVFEPAGFAQRAFLPCYGLAESTLIVTGAPRWPVPRLFATDPDALRDHRLTPATSEGSRQTLVSCGRPDEPTRIAVVDPVTGVALPDGELGEVWVSGPSVAAGYWRRPAESTATFGARIAGSAADPFLRTGDLGAVRDGELYIVGRLKDMIVIRGRNVYPDDVEWTAAHSHPALRSSCGAAFAIDDGEQERLALVYELTSGPADVDTAEVAATVRAAVVATHGVDIHLFALIRRGGVLKTSSGKVRRAACRAAYLEGRLPVVAVSELGSQATRAADESLPEQAVLVALPEPLRTSTLADALSTTVARRIGDIGDTRRVGTDDGWIGMGLDSLGAMELCHRIERRYGVRLPASALLADATASAVAARITAALAAPERTVEDAPVGARHVLAHRGTQPTNQGPLLPIQQALWYESEIPPNGPAYLLVRALRLRGPFDRAAFDRALNQLIARQAGLRTGFTEGHSGPMQVVADQCTIRYQTLDDPSNTLLIAWLADEAARPLPLGPTPPVRITLLRLDAQDHVVVLAAHHAVVDFWSLVIVVRELFARYAAHRGRVSAAPPELPTTPIEYAARRATALDGPAGEGLRRYWLRRLAGVPAVLDLPTDRPRPPARTFRGATHPVRLDRELTAGLHALSREHRTTLFTTVLTAYHLLLSKLSGQSDFVVGTVTNGRDHADLVDVVGCFVNLLPIRMSVADNASFATLLAGARDDVLADLHHASYPFAELVGRLRPARIPGCPVLIQTLLVFHAEQGGRDDGLRAVALGRPGRLRVLGELEVDSLPAPQQWTHMDITVNLTEIDHALTGVVEYDTALFDASTIARLTDHFTTLLRHVVAEPKRPVGTLALVPPDHRAAILAAGRGPKRAREPTDTLPGVVAAQARRTPHAVAVAALQPGGITDHVTYRALWRWAASLSARLSEHGVGAEDTVGVLLDRSPALLAAVLAVLHNGAAYLPLDPADPPSRVAAVLADAGVRVVLTSAERSDRLPVGCISIDPQRRCVVAPTRLSAHHPEQAAYVIYTSGSTGRPKGVVVAHRAIVNRLQWMQEELVLTPADRVAHKTPIGFDVSVWELLWPLVTGACVALAPPGSHRDAAFLAGFLREQQVTTVHFVPSMLRAFLADAGAEPLPALSRIVCSGEALPVALSHHCLRRFDAALFNLYGPTEAAVDVTWWRCQPGAAVPIGLPISNVEAHVLGTGLALLPAGFRGELHLGGACLARGYLHRPALTAAAFVPRPWPDQPGARLYRTGDQARRRADRAIEYLGRLDQQVKISGVRVELGEVDAALRAVSEIQDAASAVQQGVGGTRLVGYLVPINPAMPPRPDEIRRRLSELLPAMLVPAELVVLPVLPTTSNGKLDRTALPSGNNVPVLGATPPRTALERRIAAIWGEVLGVGPVGVDDEFFTIGGDSIKAVRLVAALHAAGVDVSLADIANRGTVSRLAAIAGRRPPARLANPIAPFALCPPQARAALPAGLVDAYPISMAQRAVLAHQLAGTDHEVYVTSVRVRAAFNPVALRQALGNVLVRHAYLRSNFLLTGVPEPLQLVHDELPVPLTIVDLRARPSADRSAILADWLRTERTRPLDVTAGPLVRFCVHRLTGSEFQFALSSFALDGWCSATVLTELFTGYAAALRGEPIPAGSPEGSYADFVALEMATSRSTDQCCFWAEVLADAPACLVPPAPPSDPLSSPPAATQLVRRQSLAVAPEQTEALRRIAGELAVSLKSVLLAAHVRVLRQFTRHQTVLTGLETNGRPERPDGDRIVGVFNNIVPLRVTLPPGSWRDLITLVSATERQVLPYRRYPFARLDREHRLRDLFNTLFVYTHFHVYGELAAVPEVDIIDGVAPDQTYMPLTAHFNVDAANGRLWLLLDYHPAQFTDVAAERLLGYYCRALALLAADPDGPCLAETLLPATERRRLLQAGQSALQPLAPASVGTVHEMILGQAGCTPDAIAVIAAEADGTERHLTYRSLVQASARLAAALVAAGVGPGAVVAVPARRSIEMVVGLLAVMRAGGAYLPIELDQPDERTHSTLEAAGVTVALDLPDTALAVPPGCRVVPIWAQAHAHRLPTGYPAGLAYALCTSGSTGSPKLIGVPHAAVVNYLQWCADRYLPGAGRTPVHSPLSFDLTVTMLLAPLAAGGTAHLLAPDAPPEALGTVLAGGAAGPLKITPAHLEAVGKQLQALAAQPASACLVVGGERLHRGHLAPWLELAGQLPVINEYGPSEATVGCCTYRTTVAQAAQHVPIGVPITGVSTCVLDAGLEVPQGVVAELHVGGIGLARGYLGLPGLTASRFLPDHRCAGGRLYRTGDLVRLDDDGLLHFVGRADRQIKIRGYRVEPAEIEHQLGAHPSVHAAAVVGMDAPGGRRRLVGYWVPTSPDQVAPDLAGWLARRLPTYLVPAEFIRLSTLPLTRNGKVDYPTLADPHYARRHVAVNRVEALSDAEVQQLLAQARAAADD
jgi:amino acid adenylation domain-containing protein